MSGTTDPVRPDHRRTVSDGRKTVPGGEKASFFVFYKVDEDEVKHNLTLDEYGEDDRWVFLEPAERSCTVADPHVHVRRQGVGFRRSWDRLFLRRT